MISWISKSVAYIWVPDSIEPAPTRGFGQGRTSSWACEPVELFISDVSGPVVPDFNMEMRPAYCAGIEMSGDQVASLNGLSVQGQAIGFVEIQIDVRIEGYQLAKGKTGAGTALH